VSPCPPAGLLGGCSVNFTGIGSCGTVVAPFVLRKQCCTDMLLMLRLMLHHGKPVIRFLSDVTALSSCLASKATMSVRCREVKERMKKAKADKQSQKAAEAKKAGGKAAKNVPRGGGVARGGKR